MKIQYSNCRLCPRRCGVNREAGQRGYCGETSDLRIAFAGIHRGEEPPVSGKGGSGTIFISGCNLGCVFCQNYQLSSGKRLSYSKQLSSGEQLPQDTATFGRVVDTPEFAGICLSLQEQGAVNINIVTGSHAAPAIGEGIAEARKRGLLIPVVWNSSGYEGEETLEILKEFVDIYLPDLKTLDTEVAAKFFNAPDYPEYAAAAIKKMMGFRELRFGTSVDNEPAPEVMLSGVIIRHLIIPDYIESTRQVLAWFAEHCIDNDHCNGDEHWFDSDHGSSGGYGTDSGHGNSGHSRSRALLSLLTQYTPVRIPGVKTEIPSRFLSESEYDMVLFMLEEFGIDEGYCQELVTGSEWLPDFMRSNPFASKLSLPVWHFKK